MITLALLAVYAGISLAFGAANALKPGGSQDLAPVYMASRLWRSGLNPYVKYDEAEWKLMTKANSAPEFHIVTIGSTPYSPIALMNLALISGTEWEVARRLWLGLNILLALCVPLLIRRLWYENWSGIALALFVAFWLSGIGLRVGLGNGQHSLFWFSSLLAGLVLLKGRGAWFAGVLLALSLHKFQLTVLLIPYLAVKGYYRALGGMLLAMCALALLFVSRVHTPAMEVLFAYWAELRGWWAMSEGGGLAGLGNTHLYPVLTWALGRLIARPVIYVLAVTGLMVSSYLVSRRDPGPKDLELAAFLLFSLWATYHAVYDTMFFIVAICSFGVRLGRAGGWAFSMGGRLVLLLLVAMWFTDASRVYRMVNPVSLDHLPTSGLYLGLEFGYRIAVFLAFVSATILMRLELPRFREE